MTTPDSLNELVVKDRGAFELRWDNVKSGLLDIPGGKQLEPMLKRVCFDIWNVALDHARGEMKS